MIGNVATYAAALIERMSKQERFSFPIDPRHIASREGIAIDHADFSFTDLFGIIRKNGHRTIFYLAQGEAPNEERFLIAHMLGHHYLHLGTTQSLRVYCQFHNTQGNHHKREREADLFAGQLLMPRASSG
ncbi:MAG: ImmA/IrrE family metallo-endopeptidase [Sporolactobacillus sp.]|nr:ImmA/IrrE family metallo-endopeptidase [Sporolactobacillus sp.]